jgi:hypothetical protein
VAPLQRPTSPKARPKASGSLAPAAETVSVRRATPRALRHQLSASDLQVDARAQLAMIAATEGVLAAIPKGRVYWQIAATRKADGPCPLATVLLQLVLLANAGQTESALRTVPEAIDALLDDLFPASVARTLDELDELEAALEGRENQLALRRRLVADQPALLAPVLREGAAADRAEAQVQLERARVQERLARRAERAGATS